MFRFTASLKEQEKRDAQKKQAENKDKTDSQARKDANVVNEYSRENLEKNMEWDFSHARNINKQGMIMTFLGCGREKKYRKMMAKAQSKIDGELDLVKFIHSKRVNKHRLIESANSSNLKYTPSHQPKIEAIPSSIF